MILADKFTCDVPLEGSIFVECSLPGAGAVEVLAVVATFLAVAVALWQSAQAKKLARESDAKQLHREQERAQVAAYAKFYKQLMKVASHWRNSDFRMNHETNDLVQAYFDYYLLMVDEEDLIDLVSNYTELVKSAAWTMNDIARSAGEDLSLMPEVQKTAYETVISNPDSWGEKLTNPTTFFVGQLGRWHMKPEEREAAAEQVRWTTEAFKKHFEPILSYAKVSKRRQGD